MNRTRLLMIGVLALALGAFVALFVYKNLQSNNGRNNQPTVDVMVAANNLDVGTKVQESDVKIVTIPITAMPEGAPRRRSEVIGHGVILPIGKGEFLLSSKLAPENAGAGLPSLITNGMRAVSVRVNEVVSVAGFVAPGSRVDVLLTGTPIGSTEQQTTTVLQDVRVLAAGHNLDRTATGEPQNTAVITLLVSPDDAQRLTLASREGQIQLSLRNPLDTKQDDVAASNARTLYKGGAPAPATPVVHHVAPKKPAATAPSPSTGVSVEIIQGDKKQDVKFPDESPEAK